MSKIAVCGLVNLKTSVPVANFPVNYSSVNYKFFGKTTRFASYKIGDTSACRGFFLRKSLLI